MLHSLIVDTETETKFVVVSVSRLPNIETKTNIISFLSRFDIPKRIQNYKLSLINMVIL